MNCPYCEDVTVPSPLDLYHHCLSDHDEDVAQDVVDEYGLETDHGYDDGPQVGVSDFMSEPVGSIDHPMKLTTPDRIEGWARFCAFQPGAPSELLDQFSCLANAVDRNWIIAREELHFSPQGRDRLTTHVGKLEASIPFHELSSADVSPTETVEHAPFIEEMDINGIEPPSKLFKDIDPDITEMGYSHEIPLEVYREALECLTN